MINYLELVENAEDGKESPFKAMAILKELESDIKQCIKQLQPIVVEEASKYEKTFEKDGFKIEQRNGRRNFSYKHIKEVTEAETAASDIKDKYRAAWESMMKGSTPIDESTGEVMEMPHVTSSPDVVVIKNLGDSLIH